MFFRKFLLIYWTWCNIDVETIVSIPCLKNKIKVKEKILFCVLRTLHCTFFFIKRMIWTGSLLKWKDVRCQHPSSLCDIKCKRKSKSSILKFASPHKTSIFMAGIRHTFLPLSVLYEVLKYLVLGFMTECLLILHFHKLLSDVSQSFLYLNGYFHKPDFGKLITHDR